MKKKKKWIELEGKGENGKSDEYDDFFLKEDEYDDY